jgi:hypothetical protein
MHGISYQNYRKEVPMILPLPLRSSNKRLPGPVAQLRPNKPNSGLGSA